MQEPDPGPPVATTLDPARAATLYQHHGTELLRFALGVLKDRQQAEDVVQSAFARALAVTGPVENWRAWLFRVTLNEALVLRRKRTRQDRGLRQIARPDGAGFPGADPLVREETIDAVRRGLDLLPPDQLTVMRARMEENRTFAEIARDLNVPLGTVLTRMRGALQRLRKTLKPEVEP